MKRKVLEELAECFFTEKPERFSEFQAFVESHSSLEDYARFRAAGEQHGICWHDWPQRMRDGELKEGDYSEKTKQYHLYTQWLAQEQIRNLSQKASRDNLYLYLDLPVGVHPYSYDVWREREVFRDRESTAERLPTPSSPAGKTGIFRPFTQKKSAARAIAM